VRIISALLIAAGVFAQSPRLGCEPHPEVAAAIQAVEDLRTTTPSDLFRAKASAVLRGALDRHPDDIFGNLRYAELTSEKGNADVIAFYRARMELNAADPRYAVFYAASLVGTNTPEALKRLAALASDRFPYPHLVLGRVHSYPAFKDEAAVASNLTRFIRACPSYLPAYSLLRYMGTGEDVKAAATALRSTLRGRSDRQALEAYRTLWAMEFRVTPANEHAALRARIDQDLAALGAYDLRADVVARATFWEGYSLAGNAAAMNSFPRVRQPATREPVYEAYDQQAKDNPYPKPGASTEEVRRYDLLRAGAALEWIVKWPDEPMPYNERFHALARLADTAEQELIAAGQALIDVNRPGRYLQTPAIVAVARVYVERGIEMDKVPAMIERGLHEAEAAPGLYESDLFTDNRNQRLDADRLRTAHIEARDVEFHWAMKAGKRDVAARALADLRRELDSLMQDTLQPGGARMFDQRYWRAMAELAEAEGRKDAAAAHRSAAEQAGKAPVRLAQSSGGWTRPAKPLPELRAGDLNGKTWTWADLAGKTVVMNIWATWCEPCIQELPLVQKLHAAGQISVLTLNIDANPGVVAPFVKERGYTFPVLLASEFVNQLLPDGGIPRTWIVRDQVLLREQIGFGKLESWMADVAVQINAESPARSK
jgi:thiol-disulfide isomerase/thioredoxin